MLEGHTGSLCSAVFSHDGKQMATGSGDCMVRVWGMTSGCCSHVFVGHTGRVFSVVYLPDGQVMTSGSNHNTVQLWDLVNGECLRALVSLQSRVYSVAFSSNGQLVASGGGIDGKIHIWDMGWVCTFIALILSLEGRFNDELCGLVYHEFLCVNEAEEPIH